MVVYRPNFVVGSMVLKTERSCNACIRSLVSAQARALRDYCGDWTLDICIAVAPSVLAPNHPKTLKPLRLHQMLDTRHPRDLVTNGYFRPIARTSA
jgi:hypothetical protein